MNLVPFQNNCRALICSRFHGSTGSKTNVKKTFDSLFIFSQKALEEKKNKRTPVRRVYLLRYLSLFLLLIEQKNQIRIIRKSSFLFFLFLVELTNGSFLCPRFGLPVRFVFPPDDFVFLGERFGVKPPPSFFVR